MKIQITSQQSQMLNNIAIQKKQIEAIEKTIIDFIIAGSEMDEPVKSIEVKENEIIINGN